MTWSLQVIFHTFLQPTVDRLVQSANFSIGIALLTDPNGLHDSMGTCSRSIRTKADLDILSIRYRNYSLFFRPIEGNMANGAFPMSGGLLFWNGRVS